MGCDRAGEVLLTGQTQNAFAKKHPVDLSSDQSVPANDVGAGETGSRFHGQLSPRVDRPGGVGGKGQILQLDALIASRTHRAFGVAGNRMGALAMMADDVPRGTLGHPSDDPTHQSLRRSGGSRCRAVNCVVVAAGAAIGGNQLRRLLLDKSAVGTMRRYLARSVRHEGGSGRRRRGLGFGRRRTRTRGGGT